MFSNEVNYLYRASQELLTHSDLNSRNSILGVVDFYDKVTDVFNDKEFEPEAETLPDLNANFAVSKKWIWVIIQ